MKRTKTTRPHLRRARLEAETMRALSEKDLMRALGGGGRDNLGPGGEYLIGGNTKGRG